MNTELDFALELESRKARDMCSVMTKSELTDLIVTMYRSDRLKNEWLKTFFMGDFDGLHSQTTNSELTEDEINQMVLWTLGSQ